ncbi:MAG: flagellar biosynthetic protein FliO [Desulfobacteraceae bacterium]
MNTSADIWIAFGRTFAMLLVVLAFLFLVVYGLKRFSAKKGTRGEKRISVLEIHHLSPKEKLVLVDVAGEQTLIGVTPQSISKITTVGESDAS